MSNVGVFGFVIKMSKSGRESGSSLSSVRVSGIFVLASSFSNKYKMVLLTIAEGFPKFHKINTPCQHIKGAVLLCYMLTIDGVLKTFVGKIAFL